MQRPIVASFGYVQPLTFTDRGFEFFLDFCLRLAKNVLDDGFAGFRIVTDCVPALPASVLSFSDIALAVCSSLWHDMPPYLCLLRRNFCVARKPFY